MIIAAVDFKTYGGIIHDSQYIQALWKNKKRTVRAYEAVKETANLRNRSHPKEHPNILLGAKWRTGVPMDDLHEVTVTPLTGKDGATRYDVVVNARMRTMHKLYETLESAMDCFDPPISARVRSHIVEGVRGEGKPVVFCLEDALEEQ